MSESFDHENEEECDSGEVFGHPNFEDSVAQRAYAFGILATAIEKMKEGSVRDLGLEMLSAITHSFDAKKKTEPTPIKRV